MAPDRTAITERATIRGPAATCSGSASGMASCGECGQSRSAAKTGAVRPCQPPALTRAKRPPAYSEGRYPGVLALLPAEKSYLQGVEGLGIVGMSVGSAFPGVPNEVR